MPSAFDAVFTATINERHFALFGEAATYRAPAVGAGAVACTVVLEFEREPLLQTEDARTVVERVATVYVRAAEVTPERSGLFTVAGVGYVVQSTPAARAGVYHCEARVREQVAANDRRRE
jgi:hypothetical protein